MKSPRQEILLDPRSHDGPIEASMVLSHLGCKKPAGPGTVVLRSLNNSPGSLAADYACGERAAS
ncbi:hypothetical protein EYF80_059065 [Liparis tanakae]|uniref:Uncharacterized protein n=1 Tax=Liparis tanakae TaxID=230148 RepID=A0A4Z2EPQ5_9TELE|nr:hypothetical protein EYF80_059065 [Liparis tanakae]